jgi:zinc protease
VLRYCHRLLLAGAVALSLVSPASVWPAMAGVFEPTTFELDNGLQVVVVENHRAPVVIHTVWYRVGAADEPPGKSGIAHFLEHLMFKGTPSVPSGQFSKIVARHGGRDNAFTSLDYTGYIQSISRDNLELVMRMEADRMVNLELSESDVLTEREVILEERRQRIDNNPSARMGEMAQAAQYLSHPYGIPVIGWEHEMAQLSREDALAFYKTYYAPNNAILIVAGDVTPDEVRGLAEKYYGPHKPNPDLKPRRRPQEPPQIAARRVLYHDPLVREPALRRSYLAPSRAAGESEHAVPLQVLSEILGGGAVSRLYQALVVEQKVATVAGSYYDSVSLDASTFTVYGSPVPGGALEAVEKGIDEVLARLLAEGVTAAELKRAKDGLMAAAVFARDDLNQAPRVLGNALTAGLSVADVEAWPDKVAAVTADQVLAAAKAVLDERRSVTGLLLPEKKG